MKSIPVILSLRAAVLSLPLPPGKPQPALSSGPVLLLVALLALICALVLLSVVVFLSRPRKKASVLRQPPMSSHDKQHWKDQVEEVVKLYQDGLLEQPEAISRLSEIVRSFTSRAFGQDLTVTTLAEIARQTRSKHNRRQFDLLKQTLSALYPPEFADAAVNQQAQESDVSVAAGWVSSLIERWEQ